MRRTMTLMWAGPNTVVGLVVGGCALLSGGRAQVHSGVLEFHGGCIGWLLERMWGGGIIAMTLGHTVVGVTPAALDLSRQHERIHVRQYERWGPLFLPAYALCSLAAWWQGKRAYRDNYFEIEAYGDVPTP